MQRETKRKDDFCGHCLGHGLYSIKTKKQIFNAIIVQADTKQELSLSNRNTHTHTHICKYGIINHDTDFSKILLTANSKVTTLSKPKASTVTHLPSLLTTNPV